MAKFKVEVEVDTESKTIVVKDDAGNEKHLQSIIVTGGSAQFKEFYLFGWGSCADAGWALATGFNSTGDPFYRKVFAHFSQWIAKYMGLDSGHLPIDSPVIAETLEKWESEDMVENKKKPH